MMRSTQRVNAMWLVAPVLAVTVVTGCGARARTSQADGPMPHPLDPLTADEYVQAVEILRVAGHVDDESRFPSLGLHDPAKASVLAWNPGDDVERAAFAVVKQGSQTFEAIVDLLNASVVSWTEIDGVQPSLLLEEILDVAAILGENDQFVAALAARGFSIDEVMCVPHTLGNYDIRSIGADDSSRAHAWWPGTAICSIVRSKGSRPS